MTEYERSGLGYHNADDMRHLSSATRQLAQLQSGLLTIRQLAADGFHARQVNRLVDQGHWRRISSVVVATHSLPLMRIGSLWAASLHYEPCGLAGPSVLELYAMPQPYDGVIHVIGPRSGRTSAMDGCKQHTSIKCQLEPVQPARVAIDVAVVQALAWARTDRQAVFFATWAIQQGLVDLEALQSLNDPLLKSMQGKRARARLALIKPGIHSVNEFDFARECVKRGLPEPIRQRQRQDSSGKMRYTDVEFDIGSRKLIVEIDGLGHLDTHVRVDDQLRANELSLQGDTVIRVPAVVLRTTPEPFLRQIESALTPRS